MEVTQWRERGGGSVVAWLSLREGKSRSRLIKEFRYMGEGEGGEARNAKRVKTELSGCRAPSAISRKPAGFNLTSRGALRFFPRPSSRRGERFNTAG